MTICHICGKDLSKRSLDETRLLECGMCVQRALMKLDPASQVPVERPERPTERRTAPTWYTGKPWDRKKNPIGWGDGLFYE